MPMPMHSRRGSAARRPVPIHLLDDTPTKTDRQIEMNAAMQDRRQGWHPPDTPTQICGQERRQKTPNLNMTLFKEN